MFLFYKKRLLDLFFGRFTFNMITLCEKGEEGKRYRSMFKFSTTQRVLLFGPFSRRYRVQ